MNTNILVALLFGCLIYLKINEGKKNYLCYCVIALVSFSLFTSSKVVEGFDGTEGPFNDKGVLITYSKDTRVLVQQKLEHHRRATGQRKVLVRQGTSLYHRHNEIGHLTRLERVVAS